jgi:hypothetical protein
MRRVIVTIAIATWAVGSSAARADWWDVQVLNDDTADTRNELIHGSNQVHDFHAHPPAGADSDFFRIHQDSGASYEIVLEPVSGDVGPGTSALTRLNASGILVQTAVPVTGSLGLALSLRWQNVLPGQVSDERILARSAGCTTSCTTSDTYRIRALETTYSIPRFNNTATQLTLLMIQNPTNYAVQGTAWYWSATGSPLGQQSFNLAPKAMVVLNSATVPELVGASGSITISHTARHGDLAGKAVSLEPATGFAFDTLMVARTR